MTGARTLDGTIAALSADLAPVRRLPSPLLRAGIWIGAVAILAAGLSCFADLGAVGRRLSSTPDVWLAVLGSTLTAVFGAVAAFQLSVPGRSAWWAALPLPSLVLWIGSSGMGCLRSWIVPETHDASTMESAHCMSFIVAMSVPLAILMALMISRAFPLRPNLTAAVAGVAIAAGAASLLNFFHPYDASAKDLAVHLLAVCLVVGVNQLFSRRMLARRL